MRLFQAICALVVLTAAVDSRANAEGDAASIETDGSAIVINAASVSIRATAGAKAVAVATSVDIDGLISRIQALEDQRAEDITAIATLKRQMVAKEAEVSDDPRCISVA